MKHHPTVAQTTHATSEKKKPARTAKKDNGPAAPATAGSVHEHDEIVRQTAYFLYEARSREDGHELDDWLQAEAQLASMPTQDSGLSGSVAQGV